MDIIKISNIEADYQSLSSNVAELTVSDDAEYELAAELAKRITGKLKELSNTDVVAEKKRYYAEYKKYSDIESAMKKKLDALSSAVRTKIGRYVAAKEAAARKEAEERALAAAIATEDETFLDVVPDKIQAAPEIAGVSYATVIDFEVVDKKAVPDEYKIVDEKAIRAMVRARGMDTEIPGVRVFEKKQMRVSA
jgi:hypothetical protein